MFLKWHRGFFFIFCLFVGFLFFGSSQALAECVAHNTSDIQRCIDSFRGSEGGTVRLRAKTYTTTTPINMRSNIILRGAGKNSTIITSGTGRDHHLIKSDGNIRRVTIRDLTLRGKRTSTHRSATASSGTQACIIFKDDSGRNSRIRISNLKVQNCNKYGIHIKGTNGVLVRDTDFYNNGKSYSKDHNLYFRRVNNVKVEHGFSTHASGNGLQFTHCEDVIVRHFRVERNKQNGIRVAGKSRRVKINEVEAISNGRGRFGEDESGIEFIGEDSGGTTYNPTDVCVRNSDIIDHYDDRANAQGIFMYTAVRYQFYGNYFSRNSENIYNKRGTSSSSSSACGRVPRDDSVFPF